MTKDQCLKAFDNWLKTNGVTSISQNNEWLRDALFTAWLAATKNAIHWAALLAQNKSRVYDDDGLVRERNAVEDFAGELWLRINDFDIEVQK